jgi:hypothetical protein
LGLCLLLSQGRIRVPSLFPLIWNRAYYYYQGADVLKITELEEEGIGFCVSPNSKWFRRSKVPCVSQLSLPAFSLNQFALPNRMFHQPSQHGASKCLYISANFLLLLCYSNRGENKRHGKGNNFFFFFLIGSE